MDEEKEKNVKCIRGSKKTHRRSSENEMFNASSWVSLQEPRVTLVIQYSLVAHRWQDNDERKVLGFRWTRIVRAAGHVVHHFRTSVQLSARVRTKKNDRGT